MEITYNDITAMIVDEETGEVLKGAGSTTNYCMIFWETAGVLIGKESSAVTLRVFMEILNKVEYNTGKIFFGADMRKDIMERQVLTQSQLSKAIATLKEKSIIMETTDERLIINPLAAWKGSMSSREKLINSPKVIITARSKEWE
jgi:hypothetical protein